MKEIETLPGDSLGNVFYIAWRYCMEKKEPVTFIHNGVRISLILDDSNDYSQLVSIEKMVKSMKDMEGSNYTFTMIRLKKND